MNPLRTLIADDEELSRDYIKRLVDANPQIEIIGECVNGVDTLQNIIDLKPDLVFLDIQMPDLNGFQVISELQGETKPLFIFITAHDQYALSAFEVSAIDYLLKPFTRERLENAIHKAGLFTASSRQSEFNRSVENLLQVYLQMKGKDLMKQYLTRILIKENKKIFLLPLKEVYCIEASGDYVRLHSRHKNHLVNNSLNNLETQLDPEQFVRVHRSSIINKEKIKEFIPHFNGEFIIILENGIEVKLSRSYKHLFKELTNK
jgi:two-component system, LytTR family, response regulator